MQQRVRVKKCISTFNMLIVHCFADALTLNYDEQINISLFYQLLMDVVVFQNYQFDKFKKIIYLVFIYSL